MWYFSLSRLSSLCGQVVCKPLGTPAPASRQQRQSQPRSCWSSSSSWWERELSWDRYSVILEGNNLSANSILGRMALLVTLFLVLVNIFNTVTTNTPKAEGLTAIEAWMLACILFVFGEIITSILESHFLTGM